MWGGGGVHTVGLPVGGRGVYTVGISVRGESLHVVGLSVCGEVCVCERERVGKRK